MGHTTIRALKGVDLCDSSQRVPGSHGALREREIDLDEYAWVSRHADNRSV